MTFDQNAEMQKLVQTLARMDLPDEQHDLEDENDDEALRRFMDDANALYDMIEHAREILKGNKQ